MSPPFFRVFIFLILLTVITLSFTLNNYEFINNYDILKNIASFSAIITGVISGIIGIVITFNKAVEIEAGRKSKIAFACFILLFMGLSCFIFSTLSLHYKSIRPFSIGLCGSLLVGTIMIVLGLMKK